MGITFLRTLFLGITFLNIFAPAASILFLSGEVLLFVVLSALLVLKALSYYLVCTH